MSVRKHGMGLGLASLVLAGGCGGIVERGRDDVASLDATTDSSEPNAPVVPHGTLNVRIVPVEGIALERAHYTLKSPDGKRVQQGDVQLTPLLDSYAGEP